MLKTKYSLTYYLRNVTAPTFSKFMRNHNQPVLLWPEYSNSTEEISSQFKTMQVGLRNTKSSFFSPHTESKVGKILVTKLIKQSSDAPAKMICVGRAENNDVIMANKAVSKLHAYFLKTMQGDDYEIVDANSTNGTKVNHRRLIAYQKQPLVDGDRIQFGPAAEVMYLTAMGFYNFIQQIQQSEIA